MRFLEFCCLKMLGRPVARHCWRCPFCEGSGASLFVRRGESKDRFKCYRCRAWGDEADLLRMRYADYSERLRILAKLRQEFDTSDFPLRGETTRRERLVAMAWADAVARLKGFRNLRHDSLIAVWIGGQEARKHGVTPQEVRDYWREADEWVDRLDAEHMAECDDPECDAYCCRAERGLPPLTRDEIAEARRVQEEERRQRMDRCRARLRPRLSGAQR